MGLICTIASFLYSEIITFQVDRWENRQDRNLGLNLLHLCSVESYKFISDLAYCYLHFCHSQSNLMIPIYTTEIALSIFISLQSLYQVVFSTCKSNDVTPAPHPHFLLIFQRENILNRESLKPCLHRLAPIYGPFWPCFHTLCYLTAVDLPNLSFPWGLSPLYIPFSFFPLPSDTLFVFEIHHFIWGSIS